MIVKYFLKSLFSDYYHLHDDELTIECHVHGVPRPKVVWKFGAFEVQPSYKYTILEEAHGIYKLLIYRPTNRDSGRYMVYATNSSGTGEIMHNIEVQQNLHYHARSIFRAHDHIQRSREKAARKVFEEAMTSKEESDKKNAEVEAARYKSSLEEPYVPPKNKLSFATHLRDRIAVEGSTIKLYCTINGPSPYLRWFKDDKPLQAGDTIRNNSSEGRGIVELRKVTQESSGTYKCQAKNDFHEIESACVIKVYSAKVEGDEQEPMFALSLRGNSLFICQ